MKTHLINGKSIADRYREKIAAAVANCQRPPHLAVILVGDNPASLIYVKNKQKLAQSLGITADLYHLSPVLTESALMAFIQELNENNDVDGILVQLPLPAHINENAVLSAILPQKDVDGLHPFNLGQLFIGAPHIIPCTPLACMHLIESVCPDIAGKTVAVIGKSRLVGRPVAQIMLQKGATVLHMHSKTQDLEKLCQLADIIITATGKAGLITPQHVKKGAIVIDVGIVRDAQNGIVGDADFKALQGIAGAITPVPGGVGPMTVMMLMQNVLQIYQKKLANTKNI